MQLRTVVALALVWGQLAPAAGAAPPEPWYIIPPEQRHIQVRDPAQLPKVRLPDIPPPPTIDEPLADELTWELALDEAIRTALANAEAIRVLAGVTAVNSGRTIYDPAITNTQIDQQRARFDPLIQVPANFFQTETPQGVFVPSPIPGNPPQVRIQGTKVESAIIAPTVSKTNVFGGTAQLSVNVNPTRVDAAGLPLNPQTSTSTELSLVQPLLQGMGRGPNLAPIVIARIDTERSFFQLKDSVQELVRGVIDAYWTLVFTRTDVWARRQQVEQAREAFERSEARLQARLGDAAEVAQARAALQMLRANLIGAEANLLQQEAALRNLLGLPPSDARRIIPVTPPTNERLRIEWNELRAIAADYRPDLIELKLILEADDQRLLIARNQALPQLDAIALYRWNGLEGRTPDLMRVSSEPGQFTDWQLGVNFAVPLGLRQSRAVMRQQELILARDRANLTQALHNAAHELAANYRNMAQFYQQYLAYRATREAARINLERQLADFRLGRRALYVNVLQAITDWGNAVSLESQALTRYNTELANLERDTGTILETHGVRFFEERYWSIGPMGRLFSAHLYPRAKRPTPNVDQYPVASNNGLDLLRLPPIERPQRAEPLPASPIVPEAIEPGIPAPLPPTR